MAEERSVGLARAPETRSADDTELTKEELQRRMEQARESITQTVAEIKETVSNQYNQVRESISETLDWREQFRRRPVPFIVGAVGVGLLVGYTVGGAFGGGGDDEEYFDGGDDDVSASLRASGAGAISPARSYAATGITGGASRGVGAAQNAAAGISNAAARSDIGATGARAGVMQAAAAAPAYESAGAGADVGPETRPQFSNASTALVPVEQPGTTASAAADEPAKPGLIDRIKESGVIDKFKESKAYDRLQDELSHLGDRVIQELSTTARNVVVPALLSKVKDLIGIDLTTQREVAQRSRLEHEATQVSKQTQATDRGASSAAGASAPSGGAAGGASAGGSATAGGVSGGNSPSGADANATGVPT